MTSQQAQNVPFCDPLDCTFTSKPLPAKEKSLMKNYKEYGNIQGCAAYTHFFWSSVVSLCVDKRGPHFKLYLGSLDQNIGFESSCKVRDVVVTATGQRPTTCKSSKKGILFLTTTLLTSTYINLMRPQYCTPAK